MEFDFIFDAILVLLLGVTIFCAFVLNRKLSALHAAKGELAVLMKDFAATTGKAQTGLHELHAAADGLGDSLQQRIDQARHLEDDLSFLLEKGSTLADRLEGGISAGRSRGGVNATAGSASAVSAGDPRAAKKSSGAAGRDSSGRDGNVRAFAAAAQRETTPEKQALMKALRAIR